MNVLRLEAVIKNGTTYELYLNPEAVSYYTAGTSNTTDVRTTDGSSLVINMPIDKFDEKLINNTDAETQLHDVRELLVSMLDIEEEEEK